MHVFNENSSVRRMRVALVSDSHGFVEPRVIEAVRTCHCVAHAGDVGSDGVLDALRAGGKVYAVRGNNDLPSRWPGEGAGPGRTAPRARARFTGWAPGGGARRSSASGRAASCAVARLVSCFPRHRLRPQPSPRDRYRRAAMGTEPRCLWPRPHLRRAVAADTGRARGTPGCGGVAIRPVRAWR